MNNLSLALPIILFCSFARADVGIDAVTVLSNGLGYEQAGFGLQLDADTRKDDWGFDFQATALSHGKRGADGQRFQAVGMARRFFGNAFVEAGLEWGGYDSEFPDGTEWTKYGFAPGVGVGLYSGETEWTLRYFLPDSTPNETSVIAIAFDAPVYGRWVIGAGVEVWEFNGSDSGAQINLEVGYRF